MISPTASNAEMMDALFSRHDEKIERLVKLIADRDLFLMAGAGLSVMSGLPSWEALIKAMEERVLGIDPGFELMRDDETIIVYTDRLVAALGKTFGNLFFDIFSVDLQPKDAHLSLVRLPFKAILTTNYDKLMLTAVASAYQVFPSAVVFSKHVNGRGTAKFLQAINDSSARYPAVIHLHGYYDIPDSIILSAGQYEEKYGIRITKVVAGAATAEYKEDSQWPFLRRIMWSLIATRRILYVGFSMADEYFKIMHDIVSDDAHMGGLSMHYLVQRIAPPKKDLSEEEEYGKYLFKLIDNAELFKSRYGIDSVFYVDDEDYNGLPNLIAEISQKVEAIKNANDKPEAKTEEAPVEGAEAPVVLEGGAENSLNNFLQKAKLSAQSND